jgi:ubiquinol-cytochrome c reductase cytochrome b subunit
VIEKAVRYLDERTGTAPLIRKALRYVFPDHWSFLLGEIALYAFIVLVGTGIYLTLFFDPSTAPTVYHGSYGPLQGVHMSRAYESVLSLSFDVKAGLLMRQTHHWAADVFVVAIVLHIFRVFFTGAFRKPRELTYYIGLTLLVLALLEGFTGYSLGDDLLSGIGLAIGYSVLLSVPLIGANLAVWLWDGQFPGSPLFESRLYIGHVLLFPVLIGLLIGLHTALIAARHHTQFRGRRESESEVVGLRTWPAQAPRSLGLMFAVTSVLFLLGGLIQINPIWLWGPFDPGVGTNGAQPDWYLGWLIGALRLFQGFDVVIGKYTLIPNPFWGGILFPTVVFAFLYLWPTIERRFTGDREFHNLLDRPRDAPWRTAVGAAFFTWVAVIFIAGSADRIFVSFDFPYTWELWFFRLTAVVLPVIVLVGVKLVCEELRRSDAHPLRAWTGERVRRAPSGGFERDTGEK